MVVKLTECCVDVAAESVKTTIRQTARDFLLMMPSFSRRLAQREYDFLLMRPVKRRILLKMYIMGRTQRAAGGLLLTALSATCFSVLQCKNYLIYVSLRGM